MDLIENLQREGRILTLLREGCKGVGPQERQEVLVSYLIELKCLRTLLNAIHTWVLMGPQQLQNGTLEKDKDPAIDQIRTLLDCYEDHIHKARAEYGLED